MRPTLDATYSSISGGFHIKTTLMFANIKVNKITFRIKKTANSSKVEKAAG